AASHADHGVELEQRERGRRVVEVDLAATELLAEAARQRVDVDLESHAERGRGVEPLPDAAVLIAGDCLVQMELASPEVLVAEGVVTEYLRALLDELAGIVGDDVVDVAIRGPRSVVGHRRKGPGQRDRAHREPDDREAAQRACPTHAAAPGRRAAWEVNTTRAARSCSSVSRAGAKAAIAISTSRTATSKTSPVRTRFTAMARSPPRAP